MLEQQHRVDPGNVKVVHYEQREDGNLGHKTHGLYSPIAIRKNIRYWNLKKYADAIATPVAGKDSVYAHRNSEAPARPPVRATIPRLPRGR